MNCFVHMNDVVQHNISSRLNNISSSYYLLVVRLYFGLVIIEEV